MPDDVDSGRRAFLRGRPRPGPSPIRPPWAVAEGFSTACTRCGTCVPACPEGIVAIGDGGFPAVDFRRGECSFCGACADACPHPVFQRTDPATGVARGPWDLAAAIAEPACFSVQRVFCRSCGDVCPQSAIRFRLAPGGAALPVVEQDACSGCGACVSACPAGAVTVRAVQKEGFAR